MQICKQIALLVVIFFSPSLNGISLRSIEQTDEGLVTIDRQEYWDPHRTALIVCDMWDTHPCLNAYRRICALAPRMNQVLHKARNLGMLIIHAPSGCMGYYKWHPARKRVKKIPVSPNLPEGIDQWCEALPSEACIAYPLDEIDCCDDDTEEHAKWIKRLRSDKLDPQSPWKRQIKFLDIDPKDAISDSGSEIWNLLEYSSIEHVILLGVHVNMCVAGRPFGLRQMVKNGKRVVLMRDMTDSMYNPAQWPNVSHDAGTELFIRYVETYICPTITSNQLIRL